MTPGERYGRMAARWPSLVGSYDGMVCGCHIHIGVTGHRQALALANHLRPWLPALQALAANSPFSLGRDTGWASRRFVEHARWPSVGLPLCSTSQATTAPPTTWCAPARCSTAG
ncbi:glutamate-cysteine ligase family protein [Streptomyces sp. NPDC056944]|uniref:glutamate-cysteine ligase family protein n=1 Tax=Streptomyces sp. NPDC056944 TaxID=3345972 RepID=UPI003627D79C